MTAHILNLLPEETKLSEEQSQIMHLIHGHVTLQDQFNQLTRHVELIYERLKSLDKSVANKVLS